MKECPGRDDVTHIKRKKIWRLMSFGLRHFGSAMLNQALLAHSPRSQRLMGIEPTSLPEHVIGR
jgi:hypothetical protein